MQKELLTVSSLAVNAGRKPILKGVSLNVGKGEIHAIMGPNGSGKSTLAQVIAGHPDYQVKNGKLLFNGKSLINLTPTARAEQGIFLSFQHPVELPGVNVAGFLRMVFNKRFKESIAPVKFRQLLKEKMAVIEMKKEFMDRYLNEGFSGGEKKKMEILHMLILEPKLVILDEVDSGLDIDALKNVANGVVWLRRKNPETAFIIITHHAGILQQLKPDFVHVMRSGKIVNSGGFELAHELEETGYKNERKK
ncbi:Fe-S cluster assembly ATPase SufC [Patescibacteria group bacterium]|nr:Fe-S cluster assembly ATPase SufC [Patescibacteria group bacterium]MBU1970435.1 Fe-S cluster assembly ATPase SufC [Patescibacteria group bacterium]